MTLSAGKPAKSSNYNCIRNVFRVKPLFVPFFQCPVCPASCQNLRSGTPPSLPQLETASATPKLNRAKPCKDFRLLHGSPLSTSNMAKILQFTDLQQLNRKPIP